MLCCAPPFLIVLLPSVVLIWTSKISVNWLNRLCKTGHNQDVSGEIKCPQAVCHCFSGREHVHFPAKSKLQNTIMNPHLWIIKIWDSDINDKANSTKWVKWKLFSYISGMVCNVLNQVVNTQMRKPGRSAESKNKLCNLVWQGKVPETQRGQFWRVNLLWTQEGLNTKVPQ